MRNEVVMKGVITIVECLLIQFTVLFFFSKVAYLIVTSTNFMTTHFLLYNFYTYFEYFFILLSSLETVINMRMEGVHHRRRQGLLPQHRDQGILLGGAQRPAGN